MVDIHVRTPTGVVDDPATGPHGMNAAAENVAVVAIDGGGSHRIPLPLGTTHLQVQRRMAGDYRAELKCGHQYVDAAAWTLAAAIETATHKVAA